MFIMTWQLPTTIHHPLSTPAPGHLNFPRAFLSFCYQWGHLGLNGKGVPWGGEVALTVVFFFFELDLATLACLGAFLSFSYQASHLGLIGKGVH